VEHTILALLAVYLLWNSLYYFPYVVDDAFISLRYAYQLTHGEGLVYNVGEHVEGYSNFSWVMLLALFLRLGWSAITGIKCVGLLAGLGTLVVTYALARRLFRDRPTGALEACLAAGLLGLNTSVAVWSQAGLEPVALSLLIVSMVLRFELELRREGSFPWSAVLFALAWMTRPEVPLYIFYFLVRRWAERGRKPFCPFDRNWLIAAATILVPYELWGLWYYGKLLPTTYAAKIGASGWSGFAESIKRIFVQPSLHRFVFRQGWGFALMLVLASAGCVIGRRSIRPAIWVVPFCGLIFVLYAHGDWMPRHRLFVPVLPFICMAIAFGLGEWLRLARRRRGWVALWLLVCAASCVDYARVQIFGGWPVSTSLATSARGNWFTEVPAQLSRRIYPQASPARFILDTVPAGETVCIRDIGFPGYLGMNPIWDVAGLVTPTAARSRHDKSPEAHRALTEELLAVRPALFRLYVPPGRDFLANRIDAWLQADPVASSLYRELRRGREGERTLVIYLRRDLPEFDAAARLREARARIPSYARPSPQGG
jgi:hypothetical protein